jgi:hypothetical protein
MTYFSDFEGCSVYFVQDNVNKQRYRTVASESFGSDMH